MKALKILAGFVFALVLISLSAQVTGQSFDKSFAPDSWYESLTGYKIAAGDSITGTQEKGKTFLVDKGADRYYYVYEMDMDSLNFDSTVNVTLTGSINGINYQDIDTVVWSMTTADTTIRFIATAPVSWKFLKGSIQGNSAATRAKLGPQYLKLAK